ncbi:unnamed protein product [Allacma fusca]|uniref:Fatty acyl-CoA reductase n=1 Tax=Allacma fusca TaxID=39272 RepID=A0A8J2JKN1_9HEXA|nr:unnamed protein product [Allacma fusca]
MPYTFSKHLAELLVDESRFDIPVCIVRPAIVTVANKEPIPGWGPHAGWVQAKVRNDADRDLPKARKQFKRLEMLHHGLLFFLVVLAALFFKILLF